MAQYDNLPVYKATYDLLQIVYKDMGSVPRDVKFTLLETLKNELTEILVSIYRANYDADKCALIAEMRERLVRVKIRIRIMHDLRYIGTKLYARTAELSESISRQLASWQKYTEEHRKESVRHNTEQI